MTKAVKTVEKPVMNFDDYEVSADTRKDIEPNVLKQKRKPKRTGYVLTGNVSNAKRKCARKMNVSKKRPKPGTKKRNRKGSGVRRNGKRSAKNRTNYSRSSAKRGKRVSFTPLFNQAKAITAQAEKIVVTSEDQRAEMKKAREMRIELKNIRVEAEKRRKDMKAESLRKGKAIDGMANIIKYLIVPIEEHLQKQEDYAKIKEQERLDAREQKRIEILQGYEGYVSGGYNLRDMKEEFFETLINNLETAKAEAEARKEREALEAKLQAEREEKIRLEAEKKAREDAERELREKEERETRQKGQEEAKKKRKAAIAPDKEKINTFMNSLEMLDYPEVKTAGAKAVIKIIDISITKLVSRVSQELENL